MGRAWLLFSSPWAVVVVGMLVASGQADEPEPPVWPARFHAVMSQNRSRDLGVVDLWYDYVGQRNLNVIQSQSGEEDGPLFDNERGNGSTYYYLPAKAKSKYCKVIDFEVGIIKPDWLKGATFLGQETSGIYDCYRWEQGEIPEAHLRFLGLGRWDERDLAVIEANVGKEHSEPLEGRFITYWSEVKTGRPVRFDFFDGSHFEVIRFDEGATMDDVMFQIPAYCFSEDNTNALR